MTLADHVSFLEAIASSPAELWRLQSLGAETPLALLALIESSPEAFANFVGSDRARLIVRQLRTIVGPTGPLSTRHPVEPLGVPLRRPPLQREINNRKFLNHRDQLFAKLEHLKAAGAPLEMVERAERQLDDLLERQQPGPVKPGGRTAKRS